MTKRVVYQPGINHSGWAAGILISVLLLSVGYLVFSTDELSQRPLSLRVYIDPDNGCQYLGRSGAVVPRLDYDGEQMGCRDA